MSASDECTNSTLASRPNRTRFVLRFARYFALAFLPSALLIAAPVWNHRRVEEALLRVAQRNHLELESKIIAGDFRSVAADLLILADSHPLRTLLENDSAAHRDEVANEFRIFANRKRLFDQIRYINELGQEVVRVNWRPDGAVIVSASDLQSKRDRYYFTETMRRARNEIFVSPFDLNVEEDQIEQPVKPTIRFATPVFNHSDQRRGIVIVNYLGQTLLDKLARTSVNSVGETWLLNSDGYWLYGPDAVRNWAFMYPELAGLNMVRWNPGIWAALQNGTEGQFDNDGGLYTFRTVRPVEQLAGSGASGESVSTNSTQSYYWIIVSYVSSQLRSARTGRLWGVLLPMESGLACVVGVISWLLVKAHLRHEQAQLRFVQSTRLAAIGQAMAGLTHESRNALQRSQSGLELLARRVGDRPEALALIQQVQDAQQYLYNLYETVRGYAAPLEIRRRPTDLLTLAQEVWKQSLSGQPKKGAAFRCESNGTSTICSVDPVAVGQVFRNLFDNALAATPEEALVQVTWTDSVLDGKPALSISIRDNGPGMTSDERSRIFEPFFTTKLHGTGLGMAISKRIVESHGGRMAVGESNGQGAELVVTLPRNTA